MMSVWWDELFTPSINTAVWAGTASLSALERQDNLSGGSEHKAARTEWAQEAVLKFFI